MALGWVPRNEIYGARFSEAFQSDAAWYEINRYSGSILAVYALVVLIAGFVVQTLPIGAQGQPLLKPAVIAPISILVRIAKRHAAKFAGG